MLKKLRHRFAAKSHRSSSRESQPSRHARRLRLENLEARHLLTGGLTLSGAASQDITLNAGAPLQLPINAVDTNGDTPSYTVTSSNPAISTLLPTTNPDLLLNISYTGSGQPSDPSFQGTVIIELFKDRAPNTVDQIVSLTNQHFYDGVIFHRVVAGFVNQAGQPTPADVAAHITVPTIDDEITPDLRYTSAGDLGMARSNHDTDTSEFFVTVSPQDLNLDYQYTMFGHVVSDPTGIMAKINAVSVDASSKPLHDVTITTASIINDGNNLALQIAAPLSATAGDTGDVTVTATDAHGGTATQIFHVTIQPDSIDPPPFLLNVTNPPSTTVNTPVTFQLPAFDLHGDAVTFETAQITTNLNVTVNTNVNATTGSITATPSNGLVGVVSMIFGVKSSEASASGAEDTQTVPLFIDPAAPTSVTLVSGSDTGAAGDGITSLNNADSSHTLQFMVTGVTAGDRVDLFNGLVRIGSAVASSSTVIVTTDGAHKLTEGNHTITAKQTLANKSYTVGNTSGTVDLASPQSAGVNLTVDTVGPTVTDVATPAAPGSTFHVGESLNVVITFGESVFVTGTPRLALNDTASVKYSSGSGTTALTFVYTVAPGQNTTDLDYASTAALTLNGGTINDAAGNAAVRTLPAIGTDNLAVKNITITSPPGVPDLAVTITPSAATALAGGSIAYTINVTNSGTIDATNVSLTDTLPASVSFGSQVQASGPSFTLNHTGNTVADTIDTLAVGASATLTVVVDVGLADAAGTVIANTVTVSSSSTEANTDNNTATTSVTVVTTGIMLSKNPFDSTKNDLVVSGTAGNDNISFLPAAGGGVSVNMNGKLTGPFLVTGRIVAMGQAGNDVITVSPSIKLPAFLYAGAGIDKLSGGGGDNVLVGGGGAATLIGGGGRNVIIAGSGRSTLYSSKLGVPVSSNSGSILIAGSTDFDKNDVALSAIMHEWGSSDLYATRISKIRTGLVAPGVALNSATIHQTAHVVDQLYASPGGYDWFLNLNLTAQMLGIDPHKKSAIQIN
jgi:uncharacterized repeat protein (TIGR01451 family)